MAEEEQLTEEQARAVEEELAARALEIDKIAVEEVLIQTVVTLINLGAHKAGLVATRPPEGEGEEDAPKPNYEQLRVAIEGARALLPLVESKFSERLGEAELTELLGPLKESLTRLQMVYVRGVGASGAAPTPGEPPAQRRPQAPTPAQPPSRLWVPGQGK